MTDGPRRGGEGERRAAPWGDPAVFDALVDTYMALVAITSAGPRRPGASGRGPEGAWACAQLDIPEVNRVLAPRFAGPVARVEAAIEAMEARFEGRPHTWWLDPGVTPVDLPDTVRWVTAPRREAAVTVMALELAGRVASAPPRGVTVARATSATELVQAERLCAMGFGADGDEAEAFGDLFGHVEGTAGRSLIVAIAALDGRPAASALGIMNGDLVGVYNVATLGDARRRGLGRAALDVVLGEAARSGARRAVLESSAEGHGLYLGMGFRDAGEALVLTVVPPGT